MKQYLLTGLVLLFAAAICSADFQPPVRLKAGGVPIRVESPGFAAPCWVDVDGDGKKDLVVGQFNKGKIKVYKNLGKGNFAEGVWLQADGKDAEIPGMIGCASSTPQFVDIDGDGKLDIISGSYTRNSKDMAGLFHVLYGNKDGTFRKAEILKGTDGQPLMLPMKAGNEMTEKICTRPFAVDWNGDGKLDLVVGNFAGTFYWFKGQGKGKFAPKAEMIMSGGKPLKLPGAHSDPFVVDWNGDGALDLLSGCNDGGVYWAKNRARKGKAPDLMPFKVLIKPSPRVSNTHVYREENLTGPTNSSRIWVADINGDGKLDILVGDSVRLGSPAKGMTEAEFKKKHAEWEKDLHTAFKAMNSIKGEKVRDQGREDYNKIYERRTEFLQEELTGFVWVYYQK